MQLFNLQAEFRENIKDPIFAGLENKIVYLQCPQPLKESQSEMRPEADVQMKCMAVTYTQDDEKFKAVDNWTLSVDRGALCEGQKTHLFIV